MMSKAVVLQEALLTPGLEEAVEIIANVNSSVANQEVKMSMMKSLIKHKSMSMLALAVSMAS
jgi:hypothetical protein